MGRQPQVADRELQSRIMDMYGAGDPLPTVQQVKGWGVSTERAAEALRIVRVRIEAALIHEEQESDTRQIVTLLEGVTEPPALYAVCAQLSRQVDHIDASRVTDDFSDTPIATLREVQQLLDKSSELLSRLGYRSATNQ